MPCPSQLPRASNKERLLSLAPLHTKVGMHRRKKGRKIWHDKSNDTRHTFSITAYRVSGFGEKFSNIFSQKENFMSFDMNL